MPNLLEDDLDHPYQTYLWKYCKHGKEYEHLILDVPAEQIEKFFKYTRYLKTKDELIMGNAGGREDFRRQIYIRQEIEHDEKIQQLKKKLYKYLMGDEDMYDQIKNEASFDLSKAFLAFSYAEFCNVEYCERYARFKVKRYHDGSDVGDYDYDFHY